MPKRKTGSPDELKASRSPRVAGLKLARQERYLHHLNAALGIRLDNEFSPDKLEQVIKQASDELEDLRVQAGGRLVHRRRPTNASKDAPTTCTVFIDECGAHSLSAKEKFEAFVLSAVIVDDHEFSVLDSKWKRWKRANLGSSLKKVHEPDIRGGNNSFWCDGDERRRNRAIRNLTRIIPRLPFAAIACVVHRERLAKEVGRQALDDSLPQDIYLMAIHFLMERVVLALDDTFGGARAHLVVEGRGPADDAIFQNEVAKLFITGTTYISPSFFRDKLFPGLEFRDKDDNSSGLQIADLLARPCGEKVAAPDSAPDRWRQFRDKLCQGIETQHSIIGLKIVPWEQQYERIWKS